MYSPGREPRLRVTEPAEGVEGRVHGILGVDTAGHLHQVAGNPFVVLVDDVSRTVARLRDHPVAGFEARDLAANVLDDSHGAVAYAAREAVTGTGDGPRAFVVGAVGADLQRGQLGLDVDVMRAEVAGVEWPVLNDELQALGKNCHFHFRVSFLSAVRRPRRRAVTNESRSRR